MPGLKRTGMRVPGTYNNLGFASLKKMMDPFIEKFGISV